MPQYFLSIVENESAYQAEGAASFDEVMHAHRSFAEAVSAAGAKIISSEALQPIATATYLRGTGSKEASVVDNRCPKPRKSSAVTTSSMLPTTRRRCNWPNCARLHTATSNCVRSGT